MRILAPAILAIAAVALAGCAADEPSETPLLVLAAASLNQVMPELIDTYRAANGEEIELVLGSTGNLAAQIENGAPADLFFAADVETVDRLAGTGRLDPASVAVYGRGELAMLVADGSRLPASIEQLEDAAFQVIAIANPEHAPYGAAARQALEGAGIWEAVQERVVYGENVAQTYQLVRSGNADVAIVARSVLMEDDAWAPVRPDLYMPIEQAAGITTEQPHPAASDFLRFVLSAEGQAILEAGGFRGAD